MDQVKPEPDSETKKPKDGFAITLTQGSGVRKPSFSTVTYSRPFSAKPPIPLKNWRAGWGNCTSWRLLGRVSRRTQGTDSRYCDLVICSANVPRRLSRTALAII